jgi:hypothetical protein
LLLEDDDTVDEVADADADVDADADADVDVDVDAVVVPFVDVVVFESLLRQPFTVVDKI